MWLCFHWHVFTIGCLSVSTVIVYGIEIEKSTSKAHFATILRLQGSSLETWNFYSNQASMILYTIIAIRKLIYTYGVTDVEMIFLIKNAKQRTFLHWAAEKRSAAVFNLLLEPQSPIPQSLMKQLVYVEDENGEHVLHKAARNDKHPDVLPLLMKFNQTLPGKLYAYLQRFINEPLSISLTSPDIVLIFSFTKLLQF